MTELKTSTTDGYQAIAVGLFLAGFGALLVAAGLLLPVLLTIGTVTGTLGLAVALFGGAANFLARR